jgi:hypothetical protein
VLYRIAPDASTPGSSSPDRTSTDTHHSSTPAASTRSATAPASTTTASTTTPGSPQVITPAQAWQQAVNRAVGREPHTTVVPGDTLTAISNLFDEGLLGVENDNPQIPNKNLIFPGERVNLSKPNPDPEVVPPIGNKQIQPIIDQYAYAQTTQNFADVHPQAFSPADRGQIWSGVTQSTYNMLLGNNKIPYPDVAGAAEVNTLDSLEPGNTDFAAANATALKEADAQWTKMGVTKAQLSPIVTAYNQYKQTAASANQYLNNPGLPHNKAIVQGILDGEGEAKANLYNAIDASLTKAAGTTESKGNWAAFFKDVSARGANISAYGPDDSTFASLVKDATTTFETTRAANSVAAALSSGGATAAAAQLATVTQATHNPDMALGIIQACNNQGSLGTISNVLGSLATPTSIITTNGKGPTQTIGITQSAINQCNEIYADLSQSVNAATAINVPAEDTLDPYAHAPITLGGAGQSAANIIGQSIAANAPKNLNASGSGVYSNAANNAITNGDGAGLTLATAVALKQDGNSGLASYLVEGAAQGFQGLKSKTDSAVNALGSTSAPLLELQSTWTPLMTHGQMAKAVKDYLKDHPNMVQQINAEVAAISNDGNAIVEAQSAWNTYSSELAGITGDKTEYKDLTGAVQSMINDGGAAFAVSQSSSLSSAIAAALYPIMEKLDGGSSGRQSLFDEIIHWPGYSNAASGLSSLRRLLSGGNKNLATVNTITGGEKTGGLGSAKAALNLSFLGLILTGINVGIAGGFPSSTPQQIIYSIYSGLGFAKYSSEIYSGLNKAYSLNPALTYGSNSNPFLKFLFSDSSQNLAKSLFFKWIVGPAYYGAGTGVSIAQAYDDLQGANSNDVTAFYNSLQAAGSFGNAIKPLIEALPQSFFQALPQSLINALPKSVLPIDATTGLVDTAALAENIAGISSLVGFAATVALVGYQLAQRVGQHDATVAENVKFLQDGLGLNHGVAEYLANPLFGSSMSLVSTLQGFVKTYGKTYGITSPEQFILELNKQPQNGVLFLGEASQMGMFASRSTTRSDNGSMTITGKNGKPISVNRPPIANDLAGLKAWFDVLFVQN